MAEKKIPEALSEGVLTIGNAKLPCAVLDDGTRVLTQAGMLRALGRSPRAAGKGMAVEQLPPFLAAKNLERFVDADLRRSSAPIVFRTKKGGGREGNLAYGYRAELLPKVCEVMLRARDEGGVLLAQQVRLAKEADILMRGFAHVGIIALIDEATGYQYQRTRAALEEILGKFIAKELQPWAKMFPDEFYEELFRLRGWPYDPESVKRPSYVGKLTNDLVYARLAPVILDELRKNNPPDSKGRRRHKHHQWLTDDVGHPKLREHLAAVIALEKAATSWDGFYRGLQRALPRYNQTIPLDLPDKEELAS